VQARLTWRLNTAQCNPQTNMIAGLRVAALEELSARSKTPRATVRLPCRGRPLRAPPSRVMRGPRPRRPPSRRLPPPTHRRSSSIRRVVPGSRRGWPTIRLRSLAAVVFGPAIGRLVSTPDVSSRGAVVFRLPSVVSSLEAVVVGLRPVVGSRSAVVFRLPSVVSSLAAVVSGLRPVGLMAHDALLHRPDVALGHTLARAAQPAAEAHARAALAKVTRGAWCSAPELSDRAEAEVARCATCSRTSGRCPCGDRPSRAPHAPCARARRA
jgi:hypothetical protein